MIPTDRSNHDGGDWQDVRSLPAPALFVDARGLIHAINPLAEQLLLYTHEDLLGLPLRTVFPEVGEMNSAPVSRERKGSVRLDPDTVAVRRNGEVIRVETTTIPLPGGEETMVLLQSRKNDGQCEAQAGPQSAPEPCWKCGGLLTTERVFLKALFHVWLCAGCQTLLSPIIHS